MYKRQQVSLSAQENIHLHFDKNFYVLGETIWYSAYLNSDAVTNEKANMLRVDLVRGDGTIQNRSNVSIDNGIGEGSIEIPLDWEEGWYTLHAYTVWNPNPTIKNSTSVNIPIYDDFKEHQEVEEGKEQVTNTFKSNLTCNLKTSKEQYERRESVRLDIDMGAQIKMASVSITVVPQALLEQTNALMPVQSEFKTTEKQQPEAIHTFYGQVELSGDNKKPLGIGVHYLKDNEVQWTAANDQGVFMTQNQLGITQGAQVFGLFNNQNKTYTSAIATKSLNLTKSLNSIVPSKTVLPSNDYVKKYLIQSQQRKKYQEIFNLEKAVTTNSQNIEQKKFQPDVVYNLADYASMTSLEEFLREVIPFIKIKNKGGKSSITIFNEAKEFTKANPIYLIGNQMSYDQEAILSIPITAVESISLYRTTNTLKNQFGLLGKQGVIGIKVKQKEQKKILDNLTNIVSVEGIAPIEEYATRKGTFNRMPDFRPLIYWEAGVVVKDGSAQISFPHSDDLGAFSIIVRGMSSDGQLFEGKTTYEVR